MTQDQRPLKQLAVSLGAMLAVATVLGLVVGVAALGAFRVVGGGGGDATAEEPSLSFPTRTPDSPRSPVPSEPQGEDTGRDEPRSRTPRRPAINLTVSPVSVAAMERIDLTGTYRGGEGATLRVQRFEGGWSDFPTTASVSDGTFTTYVMTGRTGRNRFRVVDEASGARSNPVTVRVG